MQKQCNSCILKNFQINIGKFHKEATINFSISLKTASMNLWSGQSSIEIKQEYLLYMSLALMKSIKTEFLASNNRF